MRKSSLLPAPEVETEEAPAAPAKPKGYHFYSTYGRWRTQLPSGKQIVFSKMFPTQPAAGKDIHGQPLNVNNLPSDQGVYRGELITSDPEVIEHLLTRVDNNHPGHDPSIAVFKVLH